MAQAQKMAQKKALITGITGQDGSYLAELLLQQGYLVYGLVRRSSLEDPQANFWRIQGILDQITLLPGSLDSFPGLFKLLQDLKPDECYHFAAQSFVSYSFEDEFSTMDTNLHSTHYLLSAIKNISPQTKFYFAGSSEMFGEAASSPQNEESVFSPRSIYGISKLVGYQLTKNYRNSHQIHASTGILYNHESPRRGRQFVTRKITSTAAKIKLGLAKEITLGNIEAKRDWGHAQDYVQAIFRMQQLETPCDLVIGTGRIHTVRQFLEIAFGELDLDYRDYLVVDPKFYRPTEKISLCADPSKAHQVLEWQPTKSFEDIVVEMVVSDYQQLKNNC